MNAEAGASTVVDALRRRAAAEGDRPAVAVPDTGELTYREWEERSRALAAGLLQRGVLRGHRVVLLFDSFTWLDFAVAYMGVLRAGAVAVPLCSWFSGSEVRAVLERCGASGVIRASAGALDLGAWAGWGADASELEGAGGGAGDAGEPVPDDLAEILFTSGTTGDPKAVAYTHRHLAQALMEGGNWPPELWPECLGRVLLHANGMATPAGQIRLLEPLGRLAMTTLALPVLEPERYGLLVERHRPAAIQLVPAAAYALLQSRVHRRRDLSSVRVVALGCTSAPPSLFPQLAAAFPGARITNIYECSEARFVGTAMVYDGTNADSVGVPCGRTEVRVLDGDDRELPPGRLGEIAVRWRGLPPQRYYDEPDRSTRVFRAGWTRTGDAGYLDGAGRLFLVDRMDDVITTPDGMISSRTVEDALLQHSAVKDVAVFGLADAAPQQVVAAVVLAGPVADGALRSFAAEHLPANACPDRFVTVAALPRTRSGKALKRELRAKLLEGGAC